jgi:hypothetical protein
MALKRIKIEGISGGRATSRFFPQKGQFTASCGFDPDLTVGSSTQASGLAIPSCYTKFSGSNAQDATIAIITNPKNTKIYAVTQGGKLISYSASFGSETLIGTVAGSNAGGAAYYNNYIYIFGTGNTLAFNNQTVNFTVGSLLTGATSGATATIKAQVDSGATGTLQLGNITGTFQNGETITDAAGGSAKASSIVTGTSDVARYGPLDNVPTITNAWWGGQGLTLLSNPTYPSIRNVTMPNHWAWVHIDNVLYFCDFPSGTIAPGQGIINRISTQKGSFEGDTNNTTVPSAYDVLDLPLGYYPTSIASYGTNVAISATQTIDSVNGLNQGTAALFIWNPTNEITFDQQISLPDPVASALLSRNGRLLAFSGNLIRGIRVSEYVGGTTLQELAYVEDGSVPFAGAVEIVGQRIYWGSFCLAPTESASVWAINSRTRSKAYDVQNVIALGTQGSSADQIITAFKWVNQQSGDESDSQFVVAYCEDATANKGLYRKTGGGSGTIASVIEFPLVVVGSNFRIDRIRIPLSTSMSSGSSMELSVIYDDGVSSSSVLTISNSIQPSASRVTFKTPQITGAGQNNFRLKINMIGVNASVPTGIAFPLEVWVEVYDDEPLFG